MGAKHAHEKSAEQRGAYPPWVFAAMLAGAILTLLAFRSERVETAPKRQVLISEIQAINRGVIRDEDGDYPDWIELWNTGTEPVNLKGWFLADNFRHLKNWSFPDTTVPPNGYLVVFASGKNRSREGLPLHTNFKLNERGEYLALVQPDGLTIEHEYLPKYPAQRPNLSYGIAPGATGAGRKTEMTFFKKGTPGKPNEGELLRIVGDIQFSAKRGFYENPFELTLRTATSGARIFYTRDGTPPSEQNGKLYTQPIPIGSTTTLRAVAMKEGCAPTEIDTRTFVFARDLPRQTGKGFPETWGSKDGKPVPAYYAMNPAGDENAQAKSLRDALDAIPTVSLVMSGEDLFGEEQGIYSHPEKTGNEWEKPASVEIFYPATQREFHIDCGARIQGGWNRRPEESPKHSVRLLFKKKYGPSKLEYPIFGKEKPAEFQTLVLRSGNNNSWLHWSGEERRRGDYVRDQWARDTFREMGHASARGLYVHLFLNGLYWGVYNLCERPSAPFAAAHFGGAPDDYDSMNAEKILAGDREAFNKLVALANAGLKEPERYRAFAKMVDMTNLIDYFILNSYGANGDWDRSSNWYAARRHNPPGPFEFFVWDAERMLEDANDDRMDFDDDQSPPRLFHKLKENAEFRLAFADRAQKHLFGKGVLTAERAAERFRKLAGQIEVPIVAEAARWGAYRHDVHQYKTGPYETYSREAHWAPEIARLFRDYFPKRGAILLDQFRARGLYPKVTPPRVEKSFGRAEILAEGGAIYYTLNGVDPRAPGGGVAKEATLYAKPFTALFAKTIKARVLRDGEWSALVAAE